LKLFAVADAGSDVSDRFWLLLIGLAKKKKAALSVGHVEGTILQFFPGLWLA
jgi:hypothetical protein